MAFSSKVNDSLLNALDIKSTDRIIAIRENGFANANFVITHLMKKILTEENSKMCLVIFHNTIGHYHNISKKLRYSFLNKVKSKDVSLLEPLKTIVKNISMDEDGTEINFLAKSKESIVKQLYQNICKKIQELRMQVNSGNVYLVIDDITHLLDLCVDVKHVVTFVNYCANLIKNDHLSVIINCHVLNSFDKIIANNLTYIANLEIDVTALEMHRSQYVTGVIEINRKDPSQAGMMAQTKNFLYKVYDQEIDVFGSGC